MSLQPLHPGFRHVKLTHNLHGRWLLVSLGVIAAVALAIILYAVAQPADVPPVVNSAGGRHLPARAVNLSNQPGVHNDPVYYSPQPVSSVPNGFRARLPYRPRLASSAPVSSAPNGFGPRLPYRLRLPSRAPDAAERSLVRYLPIK